MPASATLVPCATMEKKFDEMIPMAPKKTLGPELGHMQYLNLGGFLTRWCMKFKRQKICLLFFYFYSTPVLLCRFNLVTNLRLFLFGP